MGEKEEGSAPIHSPNTTKVGGAETQQIFHSKAKRSKPHGHVVQTSGVALYISNDVI